MRTKVTRTFPEMALERILGALEHELITAADQEILEAAEDLGMKPRMKGSAAFLGLRYPQQHRPGEFFDAQWMLAVLNDPRRIWLATEAPSRKPATTPDTPPQTSSRSKRPSRPPKESGES